MKKYVVLLLAIIAIFASITWLYNKPGYDSTLSLITSLIFLLGYSIRNKNKNIADKKLFNEFIETLPSNGSISFIAGRNMAGFSFDSGELNQFIAFLDSWDNAEHFFHNKAMNEMKKNLYSKISEYMKTIAYETYPTDIGDKQIVPPEWEFEQPDKFWKTVDKLHTLADEIVNLHQQLIIKCKKELET